MLLLTSGTALAQAQPRLELAPMVGARVGGSVEDPATGATYDLDSSGAWGLVADVALGSPGLFFEAVYTRQSTELSPGDGFGPGDVTLDTLLVGGQWVSSPRAPVRPFLSALVGATRMGSPAGSATHFTAALSGGVKLMASDSFGLRLEARALAIFAGGAAAGLCGDSGCAVGLAGWGTLQADLAAGVVLAF